MHRRAEVPRVACSSRANHAMPYVAYFDILGHTKGSGTEDKSFAERLKN